MNPVNFDIDKGTDVQAKLVKIQPAFKHVAIQLTFETEEELDLFNTMLMYYVSIPKMVTTDITQQEKLSKMMVDIQTAFGE